MKIYISKRIIKTVTLKQAEFIIGKAPLTFTEGACGACAVFTNKRKAKKHSGEFGFVELVVEKKP